jgi:hypothetical protein
MDVTIDEEEVAMAVMNGLPTKYDHLIVALDTMGDDAKLTLEFTESHLMRIEKPVQGEDGGCGAGRKFQREKCLPHA